jgi:hypothetical protein
VNQCSKKVFAYVFVLILHIDPKRRERYCREFYFQINVTTDKNEIYFRAVTVPDIATELKAFRVQSGPLIDASVNKFSNRLKKGGLQCKISCLYLLISFRSLNNFRLENLSKYVFCILICYISTVVF